MDEFSLAAERLSYYRTGLAAGFVVGALAVLALLAIAFGIRP